jgi:hypothetical protein
MTIGLGVAMRVAPVPRVVLPLYLPIGTIQLQILLDHSEAPVADVATAQSGK